MKNKFISIFIFICCFFNIESIYAFTPNAVVACYENTGDITVRETISGSSVGTLGCGTKIEILGSAETGDSYSYKYLITDGKIQGYVSGHYIITTVLTERAKEYYNKVENIETYKNILRQKNFPESYIPYLLETHARHPNWEFNAKTTKFNWNDTINGENIDNRNLVYYTFDDNYRSTDYRYDWATDKYSRAYKEPNWYVASKDALKFYMDPRNYLNEKYIFAFETLSFNANIHNTASVESVLKNSFMPKLYSSFYTTDKNDNSTKNYAQDIYNAGSNKGVSPLHMSTRMLLENGTDGSSSSDGRTFNYKDTEHKVHTTSGFYNFFNIGAYGDDYNDNETNALVYAMGGLNKTATSYNRPWNTPYKSILGGAEFLSGGYISVGQDTLYFQKFDVSTPGASFSHQYQQNVTAQVNEGGQTYGGYYSVSGLLNNKLYFTIPVYEGIGDTINEPPVLGNPNNYLKDLKINGKTVEGFVYNKTDYKVSVPVATTSVDIGTTTINGNAKVSGNGKINITNMSTKVNLVVTAGNGNKRNYTIEIVREDDPKISISTILDNSSVKYNDSRIFGIKPSTNVSSLINNVKNVTSFASITIKDKDGNVKTDDRFKTGDKVIITSNNETKEFDVAIYGDVDGDGEITKLDYLAVLRHFYGYTKYEGVYLEAADADKNGVVDKLDYLAILRDFYGYAEIVQ